MITLGLATAVTAALAAAPASDWATDADGRAFRVGFDPGTRLVIGGGVSVVGDRDDTRVAPTLEVAWLERAGDADAGVRWKLQHTLVAARLTLADATRLDGVLYRGDFLRWSEDGAITIPTTPPSRLPFPLDIGVSVTVLEARATLGPSADVELGLVGAELLLDAWRSPDHGSWLVVGVGPRYDLRQTGDALLHVVTPFSAARLTLHHEWCQGRQLVEATFAGGTAWTSRADARWIDHARGALAWEWTFLALDDRPLSLRLEGRWRWDELAAPDHALEADVGLRLGL